MNEIYGCFELLLNILFRKKGKIMKKTIVALLTTLSISALTVVPAMAATPEATAKAQQVVATIITPQMTDVQKVQACNDYLKNTTAYTYGAPNAAAWSYTDLLPVERADGPLLLGQGSCQGYADAFKLMMTACGIPCTVTMSNNHTWNQVSVGGQLLEVDTCWNDTGSTNAYTLLTPQQMAAKHGFVANYTGSLEEYFVPEYYDEDGNQISEEAFNSGWAW